MTSEHRAHVDGLRVLLDGLTSPIHEVLASGDLVYPYVVLGGFRFEDRGESLAETDRVISEPLRVTYAAETVDGVLNVRSLVRAALRGASPAVEGWSTELTLVDSMDVDADPTVTIPESSANPFYAVDIFQYDATAVPSASLPPEEPS